jgi:hypothetical protein
MTVDNVSQKTDIGTMLNIHDLTSVADAYRLSLNIEEKTVSSRVFADSKKLAAIRAGADITVGRYNAAMIWFSTNWPDHAQWPDNVPRPHVMEDNDV